MYNNCNTAVQNSRFKGERIVLLLGFLHLIFNFEKQVTRFLAGCCPRPIVDPGAVPAEYLMGG